MKIMQRVSESPIPDRVLYRAEAEEARSHKGAWFKLLTKDTPEKAWNAAQQIKNGRRAAFRPAGSFDSVSRDKDVLICYVGEQ